MQSLILHPFRLLASIRRRFDSLETEFKSLATETSNKSAHLTSQLAHLTSQLAHLTSLSESRLLETTSLLTHLETALQSRLNTLEHVSLPALMKNVHQISAVQLGFLANQRDRSTWAARMEERYLRARPDRFESYLERAKQDCPAMFEFWFERLDRVRNAFDETKIGNAAHDGDLYSRLFRSFVEISRHWSPAGCRLRRFRIAILSFFLPHNPSVRTGALAAQAASRFRAGARHLGISALAGELLLDCGFGYFSRPLDLARAFTRRDQACSGARRQNSAMDRLYAGGITIRADGTRLQAGRFVPLVPLRCFLV